MNRSTGTGGFGSERGATVVFAALAMTALLSVIALAVDIGMLFNARSEAQRAADAAALAGAGAAFINYGGADTVGFAVSEAIRFGELNTVGGEAVDLEPADVVVDPVLERVTVTVHRDAIRGGPLATWFARVFGRDSVNVNAVAAAQVDPSGAAVCVKPFAIYDRFWDKDGDGEWDEGIDYYDANDTGYGSAFRNADGSGYGAGVGYTGPPDYDRDYGVQITLKGRDKQDTSACCPGTGPSWYYEWAMPVWDGSGQGKGGADYRDNIGLCNPNPIILGQSYWVEPGGKTGPTAQGIENLIAEDTTTWDDVVNGASTTRIVIVPTFSPARNFKSGRQEVVFTNFLQIYVEDIYKDGNVQVVVGRIMRVAGTGGGTTTGPGAGYVHLVE